MLRLYVTVRVNTDYSIDCPDCMHGTFKSTLCFQLLGKDLLLDGICSRCADEVVDKVKAFGASYGVQVVRRDV